MTIGVIFLLTFEIWFGLFYVRKSVWSFVLTVHPVRKLDVFLFAYGWPTVIKEDEP